MLEIKHLSYVTPEGKTILDDINLKVDRRFVAITGPNGSGKSTLAKTIAGIITPTEGCIILDGEDITGMSITERARNGVSFAFQQPVRFKGITVSDIISIAAGRELSLDEACEYLSEVGLCARDYIHREINESLSGGELKRIEIATAFARSTKLTLFDEPEAGIDLWSFQSLIKVFERMYEKTNGSIMIISHQERILSFAEQIILLSAGKIRAVGSKDEIMPLLMDGDLKYECARRA
ncbi:MAG: ATP-binding cassette domain-containing protein [Clostridia bacterium]|nr:ATP-binding cassette domain-containing protein [Clostridia bacterium]